MMYRDYYAYLQKKLDSSLNALAQATRELEIAKKQGDDNAHKEAKEKAKQKIEKAARQAAEIERNLAYLFCEALGLKYGNYIRAAWRKNPREDSISQELGFVPDVSVVKHMPAFSFMLRIPFQLRKPYISKDECDFYLLDNPVRKERNWQAPMIAPTSWKGALRSALRLACNYEDENEVVVRLFGNPHESEEHQAGRLYFFPTFFNQIGFEVINPHDRKTGAGSARGPILMECVPAGATGEFVTLYMFFSPLELSETDKYHQVAQDLEVLAEGIKAMLTTYGIGAKTSSGFGIAEDKLAEEGKLAIRAKLSNGTSPISTPPVSNFSFSTLHELCDQAKSIAKQLRKGG